MLEARGDGSWLYLSGKMRDAGPLDMVHVTLGAAPSVEYDGQAYSIAGTYDVLTSLHAKGLKKIGVSVTGSDENDRVILTQENDSFLGGDGRDVAKGRAGDDHLSGEGGNDKLIGKSDNDTLEGGSGNDLLKGSSGEDELWGGSGFDKMIGGSGDDFLDGGTQNDRLWGDQGNDTLDGGHGQDIAFYDGNTSDYEVSIVGGNYQIVDLRDGSPDGMDIFARVEILRFADQDVHLAPLVSGIDAVVARDTLRLSGEAAQSDSDYLVFVDPFEMIVIDNGILPLDVTIVGANGPVFKFDAGELQNGGVFVHSVFEAYLSEQGDFFVGNLPQIGIFGRGGDDTLLGWDADDVIYGGDGDDLIVGENPFAPPESDDRAGDYIDGGNGDDSIDGAYGNDTISGGKGNDELWGGAGDDLIRGGGGGRDVAVFQGNRADYSIYEEDGELIVDAGDAIWGRDRLSSVEFLRFDDGTLSVESLQFDAHPAGAFAGGRAAGPLASSMLLQPIETPMSFEGSQPELMIA